MKNLDILLHFRFGYLKSPLPLKKGTYGDFWSHFCPNTGGGVQRGGPHDHISMKKKTNYI